MKHTCPKCGNEHNYNCFSLGDTRATADHVYLSSGNHPKLQEANELIKRARELDKQVREEEAQVQKNLKPIYDLKVTRKIYPDQGQWHHSMPAGTEYIEIQATLKNREIFENHLKTYGHISYYRLEDTRHSVKYYRLGNVILHADGGWVPLQYNVMCTDEQWERILNGDIPEELMNKGW